jgi:hypothetical protein
MEDAIVREGTVDGWGEAVYIGHLQGIEDICPRRVSLTPLSKGAGAY